MEDGPYGEARSVSMRERKDEVRGRGMVVPGGQEEPMSKESIIPFFNSMVTVSLAHFMRNLD